MRTAFKNLNLHYDLLIAAMVVAFILIIIVPVSPFMLDILLIFSLSLGLVILLTTMFTSRPLEFSVFPALLLVVTLLRLALNISSTRLILGQAYAGEVIQAFGSFVVGGNYVVGMVIFLIITVVQFVVITNGANRVSEVAARFTLDAMPGKQMSIDADVNAGLISDDEARERRQNLQKESNFFGAMDGATKFVRGDAIAGIVITTINIIGGLVIGALFLNMALAEALGTYTVLTVGDGLVAQIPAILVSTATGLLVTRTGSSQSFGKDVSAQITSYPKVLVLAGVLLSILGIVPGLPFLPFFILAVILLSLAYLLHKEVRRTKEMKEKEEAKISQKPRVPEDVLSFFQVEPLELEIGYNLIQLTEGEQGGDLLDRLAAVRRQCAVDMGIYVRPIRVRDNLQLPPDTYVFKIRGTEMVRGEIMVGSYLALNPGDEEIEVEGIPTKDPTFGASCWWVKREEKERLELKGFTIVDAPTVLVTHLMEFIKGNAHSLMGRQETSDLIDVVKKNNPALVDELIPDLLTIGEIQKVLQQLLKEGVPVRDLVTIMEVLADNARLTKDTDYLVEAVREGLKGLICRQQERNGKLFVITLHPEMDKNLMESLKETSQGNYPILEPETMQRLFFQLQQQVENALAKGIQPVILCSSRTRLPLRKLTEKLVPYIPVLGMNELIPDLEVEAVGTVVLDEN